MALGLFRLALVLLTAPSWSRDTAVAESRRFQGLNWTATTHLAEVDPRVRAELKSRRDPIADHGAPFNATDVVAGKPLPAARLVLAGHAGDRWFVCLEVGGIAHVLYLVVFKVAEQSAQVSLVATGSAGRRDAPGGWEASVSELTEALRDGRLRTTEPDAVLPRTDQSPR